MYDYSFLVDSVTWQQKVRKIEVKFWPNHPTDKDAICHQKIKYSNTLGFKIEDRRQEHIRLDT